jgi:ribosomal-protein-alanine N-acetyltransferase
MTIRRFRLTDLPRVVVIERASFGPDSYSLSTFLAYALRDRKGFFMAEADGGEVVGYALVRLGFPWPGRRRGGITSIAVDPQRRRQGIGRALMRHALEYLCEHGVDEADLEVSVSNQAAQALYRGFGFRRARLLPHYYGANRDGIRMVTDVRAVSGRRASVSRVCGGEACEEGDDQPGGERRNGF